MVFYEGNALLDFLRSKAEETFLVPSKGTWHLVYSDEFYSPIWQFHVVDLDKADIDRVTELPDLPGIKGLDLVFDESGIFSVRDWTQQTWQEFDSDSLYEHFLALGLVTERNVKTKEFNSSSSSSYHNWQMNQRFLGGVTDIDLFRMDNFHTITEIFEIKRSKIALEDWRPYSADRGGYEILHQISKVCGIDFTILYYEFDPKKQLENFQTLQVFEKLDGFRFNKGAKINLDQLIEKIY